MWNRFEKLATVLMVACTVFLTAHTVYKITGTRTPSPATSSRQPHKQLSPGDRLTLVQESNVSGGSVAVLFLSSTCPFCRANAPFYQRLTETRSINQNLRIIAAFAKRDAGATQFLADHKIAVDRLVSLENGLVDSVPTVILTSGDGMIKTVWRGLMDEKRQAEMMAKWATPSQGQAADRTR